MVSVVCLGVFELRDIWECLGGWVRCILEMHWACLWGVAECLRGYQGNVGIVISIGIGNA